MDLWPWLVLLSLGLTIAASQGELRASSVRVSTQTKHYTVCDAQM